MRPTLSLLLLLLLGCHARGGLALRPPARWDYAPADRGVRSLFGWSAPPARPAWCRVAFPGLVPDVPYRYDPDTDLFLIPLPDGKILRLRGDPDTPPPAATPTADELDDREAAWRWAGERSRRVLRGLPPPRGAEP